MKPEMEGESLGASISTEAERLSLLFAPGQHAFNHLLQQML